MGVGSHYGSSSNVSIAAWSSSWGSRRPSPPPRKDPLAGAPVEGGQRGSQATSTLVGFFSRCFRVCLGNLGNCLLCCREGHLHLAVKLKLCWGEPVPTGAVTELQQDSLKFLSSLNAVDEQLLEAFHCRHCMG